MVTGHGPTMIDRIAGTASSVGRLARAVAPVIAAINTEHKYFDLSANGGAYNPGTNDAIINLTQGIAQGTTDITRIGNSILAQNIAIRLMLAWTPTVGSVLNSFARVIILVWKENIQLNAPTAAKLFEQPAFFHSPFNKDYTDQFVVVKDKIIPMEAQINVAATQSPKFLKMFKKLDYHIRWIAGGTTDGSVNHVYLIVRGADISVSNSVAYNYYSRLNFTDN